MVERVAGRVVELSMHKFSSNLVEKCLMYGSNEQRDAIIEEMLAPAGGATELAADESNIALNEMVKDQYANFCVGRALEVLTHITSYNSFLLGSSVFFLQGHSAVCAMNQGPRRQLLR